MYLGVISTCGQRDAVPGLESCEMSIKDQRLPAQHRCCFFSMFMFVHFSVYLSARVCVWKLVTTKKRASFGIPKRDASLFASWNRKPARGSTTSSTLRILNTHALVTLQATLGRIQAENFVEKKNQSRAFCFDKWEKKRGGQNVFVCFLRQSVRVFWDDLCLVECKQKFWPRGWNSNFFTEIRRGDWGN